METIKNTGYFFAIAGSALLLCAMYSSWSTVRFLKNSARARGIVTELIRSETKPRPRERSRPEIHFFPIVQFINQDSIKIEFWSCPFNTGQPNLLNIPA